MGLRWPLTALWKWAGCIADKKGSSGDPAGLKFGSTPPSHCDRDLGPVTQPLCVLQEGSGRGDQVCKAVGSGPASVGTRPPHGHLITDAPVVSLSGSMTGWLGARRPQEPVLGARS